MKHSLIVLPVALACAAALCGQTAPARAGHVLIVSADGLHAVDLARYIQAKPDSTLAILSRRGTTYTNAATPLPNSTPGMPAFLTGGSPNATAACRHRIPTVPPREHR